MTTSSDSDGYDSGIDFGIELAAEVLSTDHVQLLSDGVPRGYHSVRDFLAAEYSATELDTTAATESGDETAYWQDWERGFREGVGQIWDAMESKRKADRRAA